MFNFESQKFVTGRQSAHDRDIRKQQMRKRILKAAMMLFLKGGLAAVTIRNIAAKIRYSPGIIYHYFDDKDSIYFELRKQCFQQLHKKQVSAIDGSDSRMRLRQYAKSFIEFAFEYPEYYELMFLIKAPMHRVMENEEWAAGSETFRLLIEEIKTAMDSGLLNKGPSPRRVALFCFASIHGLISLAHRKRLIVHAKKSEQQVVEDAVALLLEYIGLNSRKVSVSLKKKHK